MTTAAATIAERVLERSKELDLKALIVKGLLNAAALPFYLPFYVIGIVWFVATWVVAACAAGFTDGARKS